MGPGFGVVDEVQVAAAEIVGLVGKRLQTRCGIKGCSRGLVFQEKPLHPSGEFIVGVKIEFGDDDVGSMVYDLKTILIKDGEGDS